MVDGKLLHRIVVWPTFEDAAAAEEAAASADCKRSNKLTVWPTYEQAAAHTNIGAGGGGEGYVAQAVTWDGATFLQNDSLACVDSPFVTWVIWARFGNVANMPFLTTDPDDTVNNVFYTKNGAGFGTELGNIPFVDTIEPRSNLDCGDDIWHCCIFTADTNHPEGEKQAKFYIDDVDCTNPDLHERGTSFSAAFNGVKTLFGTDSFDFFAADMADFQLYVGVSLLVDGDIPVAKRRLFIDGDGKPVDPAIAVAALGDPTILFSGNASTFGTNQGTGGAFSQTGSLTNASTSPSD